MLHGTDDPEFDVSSDNPSQGGYDVCLTSSWSIAEQYAVRWDSENCFVFEIDIVGDPNIADEETVREVLGLDPWDSPSEVWSKVDHSLQKFRDLGYDGIEYTDRMPTTPDEFTTTRIINPGFLEIDCRERV